MEYFGHIYLTFSLYIGIIKGTKPSLTGMPKHIWVAVWFIMWPVMFFVWCCCKEK